MNYPELEKLISIIKKLRDPDDGCPWDLKQTHHSLLKFLLEESYEYVDAVENNPEKMEEELGDILLQVLLHSQIASESKEFDIESISKKLGEKMIRRHPHVFSDPLPHRVHLTEEELQKRWDKIKRKESSSKLSPYQFAPKENLGPALQSAEKIGKKTKHLKFDWENAREVFGKVKEELRELEEQINKGEPNPQSLQEELGDVFFTLAQLSRHLGFDAESTLRKSNRKFTKRFNKIIEKSLEDEKDFPSLSLDEKENYWKKVKEEERNND